MSDVLRRLRPTTYGFRGLEAGGRWSLAFPPLAGLKAQAVRSGSCWIDVDGGTGPVRLDAGDLVLLAGAEGFRLYTDRDATPVQGFALFSAAPPGGAAMLNGGGEVTGVGGYFGFDSGSADRLLGILPPLIHIRAGATDGALIWAIERLMRELRTPRPGGALVADHLAQTLLVEALRLHLASAPAGGAGWLYALADPQIRAVLSAMHSDPARRWTLDALAEVANMSRTSFAVRFRRVVGEPALTYLTGWRMLLAAEELKSGARSLAAVARTVGYGSESAFGAAFKRVTGGSPRRRVPPPGAPGDGAPPIGPEPSRADNGLA